MSKSKREAEESPVQQGTNEKRAYSFDFTKWIPTDGDPPSTPVVTLFDLTHNQDVTEENLEATAPSIVGNVVTTPRVIGAVPGIRYRLECLVTIDGNDESMYAIIEGE